MHPEQNVKTFLLPPIVSTAAMTQSLTFDGAGFDYCVIDVVQGTHNTAAYQLQAIEVYEHDTETAVASMTIVPALSSSQATSASHDQAIPTLAATSIGSILSIRFTLRGRKRYLALRTLAHATDPSAVVCAIARLTRGEESPISAADHDGVNMLATSASGCIGLVTA